jgi:hypothetical protein
MKIKPMTHVISSKQLADEIADIIAILESNGYATSGMDFTDIIARRLSDHFAQSLISRGVRIKNHSWELKADRSLRIKLYLPYEEDLTLISGLIQTID